MHFRIDNTILYTVQSLILVSWQVSIHAFTGRVHLSNVDMRVKSETTTFHNTSKTSVVLCRVLKDPPYETVCALLCISHGKQALDGVYMS